MHVLEILCFKLLIMLLIIELLKWRRQKEGALVLIQYLKMEGTVGITKSSLSAGLNVLVMVIRHSSFRLEFQPGGQKCAVCC